MAGHVIVALQTIVARRVDPIEPAVITVGSVHGGSKHNIISNEARLQITVRSYTDETRRILLEGIREITLNTCRALGSERDPDLYIRDDEFTPAAYNDPGLADAAGKVLGLTFGAEKIILEQARMGGEDFGRYAKHLNVPGFMFSLGSVKVEQYRQSLRPGGTPLPSLHSSLYAPDPQPTIRMGIKGLTSLALSLLEKK
jgi:hippurate hydrolase